MLLLSSIVALLVAVRSPGPGRLVPKRSELTWRHPSPKEASSRLPTIDQASVTFEISNFGGQTVRITGVESSCGCATPKVQPTILAPGNLGIVEVNATPLAVGERLVSVTLRTDSPLTPLVVLNLKILGWRDPSFLLQASGDLTYKGESFQTETREISAVTVESLGSRPRPPIIKSDLPFLEVGAPILDERPYSSPGSVQRTYVYRVNFSSSPPATFTGDVSVIDPWDPEHADRIHVQGETLPPLRVFPSRLALRPNASLDSEGSWANITVLSRFPAPEISAFAEPENAYPVAIRRMKLEQEGRLSSFSIRLESAGPVPDGEFNIVIQPNPNSKERVAVPVLVRNGDIP
jgi:hypothetical protein